MDESDDDVFDEINDSRLGLQQMKRSADETFAKAENEGSENLHRTALTVYNKLLSNIDDCSGTPSFIEYLQRL